MDHSIASAVAGVTDAPVEGVRRSTNLGRVFQCRGEVQALAGAVRSSTRKRLDSKENVVTAGGPSQNKVSVGGFEYGLAPGEQSVGGAGRGWHGNRQRGASIAIEVIGRAGDRLRYRRVGLIGGLAGGGVCP